MKKILCLLCLLLSCMSYGNAQTIIDLQGGRPKLRYKTYQDYARRYTVHPADSMAYQQAITAGYEALRIDSLNTALQQFQTAVARCPNAPANYILWRQIGDIFYLQNLYEAAIKSYDKVLQLMPREYGTRLRRAETWLALGNAQQALNDCEVLLPVAQTDSLKSKVHFVKGTAHFLLQHYRLTIDEMEQALHYDPAAANAQLMVAIATYQDGRPKEAQKLLTKYLQQYPNDEEALLLQYQWRTSKSATSRP